MLYPDLRRRVRSILLALSAPLGAAALFACDATSESLFEPTLEPQSDYANGGEPEFALCNDPTPGEKWTAEVTPSGGTFTMGPNTLIVPANAVSASGLIYLKELSSSSLLVRITSTQTLNQNLEVIVSTQNCDIEATQTVWLYDQPTQTFDEVVDGEPDTQNETMRFWTIQPGAYALAD